MRYLKLNKKAITWKAIVAAILVLVFLIIALFILRATTGRSFDLIDVIADILRV